MIYFKVLLLLSLLFSLNLQAEDVVVDVIVEDINQSLINQQNKEKAENEAKEKKIADYLSQIISIENSISKEQEWVKSYASYLTFLDVRDSLLDIKKRIKYLEKHSQRTDNTDELNGLISKENILTSQIDKLKGSNSAPFSHLITPPQLDKTPIISNLFDIFAGVSYIKILDANLEEYQRRKESLKELITLLSKEDILYKNLALVDEKEKYKTRQDNNKQELDRFTRALDTINATYDVYEKRLDIIKLNLNKDIEKQVVRLTKIGLIILFVIIFFFLVRLAVKKYIEDNERLYMANKFITVANFIVILFILFFNYIENAAYLVTILGFASAGIAIAMKDWFMSILGWLVIVFGGSIHVGDRIRVDMDGMKYVGDVMDISLLRMTILEDITLTSIMQNRRAGRIIFVPNNYVFTRMIANYTHSSLKTVWDGIKITITFDSNHKKAMHIVKGITRKYSKGYTDITRKQLNKLRNNYSLKNTNVDPRIYSFIAPNGLDIEAWYLTNAYGTLTLRSVISTEIVDAFKEEADITIAYPTQKLNVSMQSEEPIQHNHELV